MNRIRSVMNQKNKVKDHVPNTRNAKSQTVPKKMRYHLQFYDMPLLSWKRTDLHKVYCTNLYF